ncbi:MAG: TolC family protein [Alistipes sp.]|nr:TolC family protein [Alistipes sp.]
MKSGINLPSAVRALFMALPALAASPDAGAADTLRVTLQEAIQTGILRSVDAVAAKNDYIASYWEYRTYLTELLPVVELTSTLPDLSRSFNRFQNDDGSYTYVGNNYNVMSGRLSVSQNIPFTGGKITVESGLERLHQQGSGSTNHYRSVPFAVTLEQQLGGFNSLKWLRRIEPLKYGEAQKNLASESEEIALTVINYYFNLLTERSNLEIARQNHENAVKLYEISEARFRIGQLSEVDLMQMHSSMLSAEMDLISAEASHNNRMLQLRSYLGYGDQTVLAPEIPGHPAGILPELPYDEVLEKALENNPFTLNVQRRILESSRDINRARAERWDVTLFASFGMSAQESSFRRSYNTGKWRDDQSVQVGIRLPIVDWGKGKGKVRVAQANREAELARIEKEQMDFRQNIFMQVQYFNDQPRKLELAAEMDRLAARRYETSVEAFILGKIDILSLNDSRSAKDVAKRNYINQLYLLWWYHYQIRALTLFDFVENRAVIYERPGKKRNFTFDNLFDR